MIRTIIIDDEINAILSLKKLLIPYEIEIVGEATSVDEAIQLIANEKPDLLFLDIEMPHENGFNLLERVEDYTFSVIFTTAYNEYAIKAIRFSALDYLLKPINVLELDNAIERFLEEKETSNKLLQELKNNLFRSQPTTIALREKDKVEIVRIEDIIRFESDRNYTWVYFKNNERKLIVKTLAYFEELLNDNDFIRIHKSHLISTMHILKINKLNEYTVLMSDGSIVPIAFRRRNMVLNSI